MVYGRVKGMMLGPAWESDPVEHIEGKRGGGRWILWRWVPVGLVAVSTLAGFLGAWFWAFDLAANFRVHLLAVSMVAAIGIGVLAVRRHNATLVWTTVILVACVVINGIASAPLWKGRPSVPPTAEHLTVGHVNMQGLVADSAALGNNLATDHVDVFVVLDTSSTVAEVARSVPDSYTVSEGPSRSRSLVIARVPLEGISVPEDERLPPATVEVVVRLGGQSVHLLALHTLSPVTPSRSNERDRALDAVGDWQRELRHPAVVFGDLNATRWSAAIRRLLDTTSLENSEDGFGFQPSYPAALGPLGLPIDQSLHTPELTATERAQGPTFGSGHRSLSVTYALTASPP